MCVCYWQKYELNEDIACSKNVYIFCFRIISILTVFVNKALLSSEILELDAPLFVTFYQCVVSSVICFTWSNISDLLPQKFYFPKGSPLQREVFVKVC